MEFDEKELRREISYAIKNLHGIRLVRDRAIYSIAPMGVLFLTGWGCLLLTWPLRLS